MKKLLNTLFINGGGVFPRKGGGTGLILVPSPRSPEGGQRRSDGEVTP